MDLPSLAATLAATLSPDFTVRSNAEAALTAAAASHGFAAALLAIARDPAGAPVAQSALVLLKGLVLRRWDAGDERFVGPELPDAEKASLKASLLAALADPATSTDSKLVTALGMVVSAIYQSDEWPELLPALVSAVSGGGGGCVGGGPGAATAVAGAVRVLSLIADDVSDDAAVAAAPVLLPAMRGLVAAGGADAALRTGAMGVGASLLGALAVARGVGGSGGAAVRRVVDPEVGPWLAAVAGVLRESAATAGAAAAAAPAATSWALPLEGLRLATQAAAAFPRAAAPAAPDVAAAAWAALGAALPAYVARSVGGGTPLDADGDGGSEADSDGEDGEGGGAPGTPAALVTAALEFFSLAAASRPGLPPASLPDLMAACLVAMRAPRAARAAWAVDADAFVGDEDDDASGPRGAGEVLLATAVFGDEEDDDEAAAAAAAPRPPPPGEVLAALAAAVRGALAEADASRAGCAPGWWLPREAALLALGAVRGALVASPGAAAAAAGLPDANAVMAAALGCELAAPPAASEQAAAAARPLPSPPPLLTARALWLAARLAPHLDPDRWSAALAAAAAMAAPASPAPVQVQACRALAALLAAAAPAEGAAAAAAAARAVPPAVAAAAAGGVVGILAGDALADRALALALDALTALATAGVGGAGPGGAGGAATAALRAWAAAAADPLVAPAAEDAVLALAAHPSTQEATFAAALPALAAVVRAPSDHGGTVVTAALELLAGLLAVAPAPAAAAVHAAATPPALAVISARGGGDPAACRAACDYVRALVRAGGAGLVAAPGALAALAGPLAALVSPPPPGADAAEAADAAGRSVPALASLLRRAPPDAAAAAVREAALAAAARLACADTPAPLGAELVGLLAAGVRADPPGMVAALAASPLPAGGRLAPLPPGVPPPDPAAGLLAPALVAWFGLAGEVSGRFQICASTAALGALALSPPHPGLDGLVVPGAPIHDPSPAIRTRARARAAGPQAWSALPARAKALALLADTVLEEAEGRGGGGGGGGGDDDDDGWESASTDGDDENDENDSPGGKSSVAAALARGEGGALFASRLGCLAGGLPGGWDEGGAGADADADADADPSDPLATARPGDLAAADLRAAMAAHPAALAAVAGLLSEGQRAAVEAAVRG